MISPLRPARVMNSAKCAYRRPPLLVLIAAVTSRLERSWALSRPASATDRWFTTADTFACHNKQTADWETSSKLVGTKTSEPSGPLHPSLLRWRQIQQSVKCRCPNYYFTLYKGGTKYDQHRDILRYRLDIDFMLSCRDLNSELFGFIKNSTFSQCQKVDCWLATSRESGWLNTLSTRGRSEGHGIIPSQYRIIILLKKVKVTTATTAIECETIKGILQCSMRFPSKHSVIITVAALLTSLDQTFTLQLLQCAVFVLCLCKLNTFQGFWTVSRQNKQCEGIMLGSGSFWALSYWFLFFKALNR